jgi:hypothetical protein
MNPHPLPAAVVLCAGNIRIQLVNGISAMLQLVGDSPANAILHASRIVEFEASLLTDYLRSACCGARIGLALPALTACLYAVRPSAMLPCLSC